MQFWHRLALAQLMTFAAILLVVVASRQQIGRLHDAVAEASEEYQELRALAVANAALTDARAQARRREIVDDDVRAWLVEANRSLGEYLALQDSHTTNPGHQRQERALAESSRRRIADVLQRSGRAEESYDDDVKLIDGAVSDLKALLTAMDEIVSKADERAARELERSKLWGVGAPLVALALAILASLWQYFSVVLPVRQLRESASQLACGNLSARVVASGRDEIASLASDFNKMAGELESLYENLDEQVRTKSRDLAHAERLTSVGLLAAGVAHEINNPLSIIHGYAQEARQRHASDNSADAGDVLAVLDVIMEESRRCRDIVRRLLNLASPNDSSRTTVDLSEVVASAVQTVRDLPRYRGRRIDLQSDPQEVDIRANRDEIKQVVLNLLINGLEATDQGGVVRVSCARQGDAVVTEFLDDGCGMTEDALRRVFDPFYSTRKFDGHRGVGLGLSVSYAIIQQHGGQLTAQSDGPGRGSRFTITMPAAVPGTG